MYYYEIWVGSPKFQGNTPLTYSSEKKLGIGEVVSIPLRNKTVLGFVVQPIPVDSSLAPKVKPIHANTEILLPEANLQLHKWLMDYYPAPSGATSGLFLPPELPKAKDADVVNPKESVLRELPNLTTDQEEALKQIHSHEAGSILLHGETGTGKTRVYIELAKESLEAGKSVVILTPEIGLTPQLLRSFEEIFQNRVVILHSNLTTSQRRKLWYQVAGSTEPLIVVGPRSALFAPIASIGLIVVDEAHESAYKQEQAPYYHVSRVASQLARLHNARCIFGSATPLVQDYFVFSEKNMPIVRMQKLATGAQNPPNIAVVDMKDRTQLSKSSMLSKQLLSKIEEHTEKGQQALLFLNRRGSARMVLCQNCGWQAICERCDIALTYHGDQHILRCHTCGLTKPALSSCPECKSHDIIYTSPGTKSLEEETKRLFPALSVRRFDGDNLADEKIEKHFAKLYSGDVDIIIGTQLVTKGFDLPKLGVVGIINADSSLSFPDYMAEERTYQQLTQVIGRVGRHKDKTSVVVQTYHPENPLLTTIITKDWSTFMQNQLAERKLFGFPPFYHMLQLKVSRASRTSAESAGEKLAETIRHSVRGVVVRGPSPQLHEKVNNQYNWQLIISAKERSKLLEVIKLLPSGWYHNIDPIDLM